MPDALSNRGARPSEAATRTTSIGAMLSRLRSKSIPTICIAASARSTARGAISQPSRGAGAGRISGFFVSIFFPQGGCKTAARLASILATLGPLLIMTQRGCPTIVTEHHESGTISKCFFEGLSGPVQKIESQGPMPDICPEMTTFEVDAIEHIVGLFCSICKRRSNGGARKHPSTG